MADPNEPAIPVIATLPMAAHKSLLDFAAQDWPELDEPGTRFALDVTEGKDMTVSVVISAERADVGGFVTREYDGQMSGGLFVTLRRRHKAP